MASGETGPHWYVDALPFVVRGALDRAVGGAGQRWAPPGTPLLAAGDRAGFWSVVVSSPSELLLRAEVRGTRGRRAPHPDARGRPRTHGGRADGEPRAQPGCGVTPTCSPTCPPARRCSSSRTAACCAISDRPARGSQLFGRVPRHRHVWSTPLLLQIGDHRAFSGPGSLVPAGLAAGTPGRAVVGQLVGGPPAKADPDFHRPTVGTCYDYGLRGLSASSGPRSKVPCEESHRALLIAAPRVSGKIDRKDPEAVFDKIGARCYRALYRTLGGTQESRALTAYSIGYYLPDAGRARQGRPVGALRPRPLGGTKLMALARPAAAREPRDDSTALCLHKNESYHGRAPASTATGRPGSSWSRAAPTRARTGSTGSDSASAARAPTGDYVWRYPREASWRGGQARRHLLHARPGPSPARRRRS